MIEHISLAGDQPVISLASDVVYLQKPYWCNCSAQALKMSLLIPRRHYPYDPQTPPRPCIVFFCGGAFQKQDRLVWIPQLTHFARQGYVVATVDYSTQASTRFPEQLCEAKAAVRFLRAHAQRLHIDPAHIFAMGESAGGQLAIWLATTHADLAYDVGENLDQSSAVQGCVAFYPVTDANAFPAPASIRVDMKNFPDSCTLVSEHTPPMLLLHGTADDQVPFSQSVRLHDCLLAHGVPCELLILDGANHSDARFYEPSIKARVLSFFNNLVTQPASCEKHANAR